MRLLHAAAAAEVSFDDPTLVSCAGLVPALRLAGQAGRDDLAGQCVRLPGSAGANAAAKIGSLVAGWWPALTASMIWTCCATARWGGWPIR
jgi:hypothetical protein